MSTSTSSQARPVYLFDSPRTCSQVFNKLWMAHPQLEHIFMPMTSPAVYGPQKNVWRQRQHCDAAEAVFASLTEAANSGAGAYPPKTYEDKAKEVEQTVIDIQKKGKLPWIKDHTFCVVSPSVLDNWLDGRPFSQQQHENPTPFDAAFLDSLTPIFLFRHPALAVPSWLRMMSSSLRNEIEDEDFQIFTTLSWTRLIFDSYLLRRKAANAVAGLERHHVPIVVETQDFIYKTEAVVRTVCEATGVSSDGVQLEWEPTPKEQQPPIAFVRWFLQDMFQSTGIQRAQQPVEATINLDDKLKEWTVEFGDKKAEQLHRVVLREMKNYEYLREFKIQV